VVRPEAARSEAKQGPEGPLRIAAFRSTALHLLPPVLRRLRARYPGIEPQVRIVREVGRGTAGEVADGRSDLAIATLDGAQMPSGLVVSELFEESYSLVHPAGHPDPRSLPLVDWAENCARTPGPGGAHRTGSRRRRSRPRTTERCCRS
jgi:DNA-binding transcriptional LysR family regulator